MKKIIFLISIVTFISFQIQAHEVEIVIYNKKGTKEIFDLFIIKNDSIIFLPQIGRNLYEISENNQYPIDIVAVLKSRFIIFPKQGDYLLKEKNKILVFESKKNQYIFRNINRNSSTLYHITNSYKLKTNKRKAINNYKLRLGIKFNSFTDQDERNFFTEYFFNDYYLKQIMFIFKNKYPYPTEHSLK